MTTGPGKPTVTSDINRMVAKLKEKADPRRAERMENGAGLILMRAIINMLSHPGTGRIYTRRHAHIRRGRLVKSKAIIHRASAPGEPPAVDTGMLRRSIGMDRVGMILRVGSSSLYAAKLEYGTPRVLPRPFMRPALAEVKDFLGPFIAGGLRRGN